MDATSRRAELSPDEKVAYAPIAPLAVVALALAVVGALAIIILWLSARQTNKPIFEPLLLIPVSFGFVMALIAARQVKSSGGSKSGRGLAKAAIWIAGIACLAYGAYLFAVDLAIRNQASQFTQAWIAKAATGPIESGFLLCLDPDKRQAIDEKDVEGIQARFDQELAAYRNNDIVRIIQRAGNQCEVALRGVKDWNLAEGGYAVKQSFQLRTPEGNYELMVPVVGRDTPALGGRTWHIFLRRLELVSRELTALGRLVMDLQIEGHRYLTRWTQLINTEDFHEAFVETLPLAKRPSFKNRTDSPEQKEWRSGSLILVDGKLPTAEKRQQLMDDVLRPHAINMRPGSIMNQVGAPQVEFAANRVFLRHNVEISPQEGTPIVAYIVLEVQGDELVAEMLRKKTDADWRQQPTAPDQPGPAEIDRFPNRTFRVVAIDFRPSEKRLAQDPPGPKPQRP